jgi:hypothetical protein
MSAQEYKVVDKGIINRNEASHSYNEELAEEILDDIDDIPKFYETMHAIIKRIKLD